MRYKARVARLLAELDVNASELAEAAGHQPGSVRRHVRGGSLPSRRSVEVLVRAALRTAGRPLDGERVLVDELCVLAGDALLPDVPLSSHVEREYESGAGAVEASARRADRLRARAGRVSERA
jgi:hypothetical protein